MAEGIIYLDEVINNYIAENDYPDSAYERLQSIAIRSYRQLHLHATGKPQLAEMEVLANKTSQLPCNFLSKIAIGVLNDKGEIVSLTEESNLGLISDGSRLINSTHSTNSDRLLNSDNYTGSYRNYGSGSRSDLGFYRIDFENNLVIYSPDLPYDTIFIEYLPIAGTDCDNYIVHPFFQEAVLSFITWHDRKKSPQEKAQAERQYWNWLRIGQRSMKPFDSHDVYNSYRKMASQAPRA